MSQTRGQNEPGPAAADDARYRRETEGFQWNIPEFFNIGVDVTDKWAAIDRDRVAIIERRDDDIVRTSFGQLSEQSNRLAALLTATGLQRGDRVAVLMPQRVETAVAHAAIYKAGAIAVPLFSLFGPDALTHRLTDSGSRFLITDIAGKEKIGSLRHTLPGLQHVFCVDDDPEAETSLPKLLAASSPEFVAVATRSDDPALIIYTSGTTGSSKGALHAHRTLLGHLPGVEMSHGGFPQADDCMWTPADWAWIGGLLDVLLPSLHHGVPVVAHRFQKFDAAAAFQLMEDCAVRNLFMPPTALKMLRELEQPRDRWKLCLRSIASGGETLGAELLHWAKAALDIDINEFYGQTECNMTVSSCGPWFYAKPAAIGKAVPGHRVAVIDEAGGEMPAGCEGDIAVHAPDPVMFLGYWRNDEATRDKFVGNWLVTGDRGFIDDEGFVHFVGRQDDVITSAGYRIGPGEIEDCLLRHPAVAMAGVVGIPDPLRTEVVTAFVILRRGEVPTEYLVAQLQHHVRSKLGGHQYPRVIHFVDEIPLTVTGKIIRRELRRWGTARYNVEVAKGSPWRDARPAPE